MNALHEAFICQFKSKDKTESGNFVEEYLTLFLDGDAAPGIENEFGYVKQFLPEITLADVNKLAEKYNMQITEKQQAA